MPPADMSNGIGAGKKIRLLDLFQDISEAAAEELYRRHVLHLVLRDLYHIDLRKLHLLDEPQVATLHSPSAQEPRFIEFWLTSDRLKVSRRNSNINEFADLKLHKLRQEGKLKLTDALDLVASELPVLEQRLRLDNYQVEGLLLLEGFDVTAQETMRRLTQLLIERDSILRPNKFKQINRRMKSLPASWSNCKASVVLNLPVFGCCRQLKRSLNPMLSTHLPPSCFKQFP